MHPKVFGWVLRFNLVNLLNLILSQHIHCNNMNALRTKYLYCRIYYSMSSDVYISPEIPFYFQCVLCKPLHSIHVQHGYYFFVLIGNKIKHMLKQCYYEFSKLVIIEEFLRYFLINLQKHNQDKLKN